MDEARRCPDHGFFAGDDCPVCDAAGKGVLAGERRRRLSTFCSGALRHFPGDVGLSLDDGGWAGFDDLVAAAVRKYDWADRETVAAVVATDPKGRYERDGDRVRASYGHSVEVDLDAGDGSIPDTLYHGTDPANLDAIREEGLRPMGRQQVHLSGSAEAAREVGRRHAVDPVVLRVDAAAMRADGHEIAERGRETYTTDRVAPEYLERNR